MNLHVLLGVLLVSLPNLDANAPAQRLLQRSSLSERSADLWFDGGDIRPGYTIRYLAPDALVPVKVRWDVSQVREAQAGLLEIALTDFSPVQDAGDRPELIVLTERLEGKRGAFAVPFPELVQRLSWNSRPGRLSRLPEASRREVLRMVFVRVLPIRSLQDPVRVGGPSPSLRIAMGRAPQSAIKIQPSAAAELKVSPIKVTRIRMVPYRAYCAAHANPSVCAAGTQKDWYEKLAAPLEDAWDWAAKAYADTKKAVLDVACAALPFVPRQVFEYALDSALVACGMPPSLPNLDQLMTEGADYLAGQVADQVGVPIADEIARDQLKGAILAGAKQAKKSIGNAGPETPCQPAFDWPYLVVTLETTSPSLVSDLGVGVSDWTGINADNKWSGRLFKMTHQSLGHLLPGKPVSVVLTLVPDMKHTKYYQAGVFKPLLYWNDYNALPTNLTVSARLQDLKFAAVNVQTGKRFMTQAFTMTP